MTNQPTTWTPERASQALAIAKDWNSPSVPLSQFIDRHGGINDALFTLSKALESAAAEIERQKALTEKALRDGQEMTAGLHELVASLRAELAAKQPAEAEAAQQGPSDEEIRDAIESVHMCGDNVTANALRLVARRAGVKL